MRYVPVPGTGTFARRRPSPRLDRRVADPSAAARAVASNLVGYARFALGRIAQRESARFTRGRSLVRSQVRPLNLAVPEPSVTASRCTFPVNALGRQAVPARRLTISAFEARSWRRMP